MRLMRDRAARPVVLMVDDDPDDTMLMQEALVRSGMDVHLDIVFDGADVLDYLLGLGKYGERPPTRPDLILIDLNMPLLDGVATIEMVKKHEDLKSIPIVVLSTSTSERDVARAFSAGAASYHTKPNRFEHLIGLVTILSTYWFEASSLPV